MAKIKNYLYNNRYIFLIIGIVLIVFSMIRNPDPDVYWHIKNGEWIVNNGIPFIDPFSYSHGNFISHEWLFDILSYFIFNYLGYKGMLVFCHILLGITLFIVYKIAIDKNPNIIIPTIISLFFIFNNSSIIVMRPAIISSLLIAISIYLLEKNKYLYIFPFLTLLCVNIHGGITIVIPLIFGIYLLGNIYENWGHWNKKEIINKTLIFLLMFLTFFITPYGIKCFTYGLTMPSYVIKRVSEYYPIISGKEDILLLFAFLVGPACMCFTRKAKLTDILMLFMGLMMGLLWKRMLILYILIFIVYASEYVSETFTTIFKNPFKQIKLINIKKITNSVVISFIILMIPMYIVSISSVNMINDEIYSKDGPMFAPRTIVQYIEENNLDVENNIMLNHYNFGGYFIFHDIPVFIDGRCEPYLEEYGNPPINKDYEKMIEFNEDTLRLMDEYNVKYIATYKNEKLSDILIENNYAKELVSDDNVILLEFINGGVTDE